MGPDERMLKGNLMFHSNRDSILAVFNFNSHVNVIVFLLDNKLDGLLDASSQSWVWPCTSAGGLLGGSGPVREGCCESDVHACRPY